MNIGRKASPPQGPYRPKCGCDLYIPMKNECAGLRELVCSAKGKCPFFKTKERARQTGSRAYSGASAWAFPYRIRRRRCCWKRENCRTRRSGEMAANELFPKRLRALRERRQIKRRVLAELCGLSQHMIRRYEEGEMEPKASSLEVLADYFEVTVDYLLGRE